MHIRKQKNRGTSSIHDIFIAVEDVASFETNPRLVQIGLYKILRKTEEMLIRSG